MKKLLLAFICGAMLLASACGTQPAPAPSATPEQPPVSISVEQHPTQEEWAELLTVLASLNRRTAAQAALVRELSQQTSTHPTGEQVAAMARNVAAIRSLLEQAGKKKEQRFSLRLPRLPHPHLPRLSRALLLIPVILLVLWAAWSSLDTLWSAIRMLLP